MNYKQKIINLLDKLNPRKLKLVYVFVCELIGVGE